MSINVSSNFRLYAQLPLDSRQAVADTTARDAIPSGERYDGLAVYCVSDNTTYQLQGGITNSDWVFVYGAGGDLWDRVGTVLTPHTSGDSVTAYDYRTTKAIGTIIGSNDWAINADFTNWTGSVPSEFTVISFGGGGGSTVTEETTIAHSPTKSAKIYGGTGVPDDLLARAVTGLTPGSGYGFGFWLYRDAPVNTGVSLVIIDSTSLGTATQQWINKPYTVTYSGASGSFTQGDTWSTPMGNGHIAAVSPTVLTLTINSGSVTTGQTITSGLGITATADTDSAATTPAWFTIIPAQPVSEEKTLTTDGWVEEGIIITVPASGTISLVWAAEDNKTFYLDDVQAATVTVVNGTVFDFINSVDSSAFTSSDKIFDFRTTGGTPASHLSMDGTGAISTDFAYLNFAKDVNITNSSTLTVGDDSFLSDTKVDLITNNLTGASTNYVEYWHDTTARTTGLTYAQMGSIATPIATSGLPLSTSIMAMKADNLAVIEAKADSQGLSASWVGSGFRSYVYEHASDATGSYLSAYTAVPVPAAANGTLVGFLSDRRANDFDYDVASYGGDLNIAALNGYGWTGAGHNIAITASDAGIEGKGGDVTFTMGKAASAGGNNYNGGKFSLDFDDGTGTGVLGWFELAYKGTWYGKITTDDKRDVLMASNSTGASGADAFAMYAMANLSAGSNAFAIYDNASTSPEAIFQIAYDGKLTLGSFGNINTLGGSPNSMNFVSNAAGNVTAFSFDTESLVNVGYRLVSFENNSVVKAYMLDDGSWVSPYFYGVLGGVAGPAQALGDASNAAGGTAFSVGNATQLTNAGTKLMALWDGAIGTSDNPFVIMEDGAVLSGATAVTYGYTDMPLVDSIYNATSRRPTWTTKAGVVTVGYADTSESHGTVGIGISSNSYEAFGLLGQGKVLLSGNEKVSTGVFGVATDAHIATVSSTTFESGGGALNDLSKDITGSTLTTQTTFYIVIDAEGSPNSFKWSDVSDSGPWNQTLVPITGAAQTLNGGITITFGSTTGHIFTDKWYFTVSPGASNIAVRGYAENGKFNFSFYGDKGVLFNTDQVLFGTSANLIDFANASAVVSQYNTGYTSTAIAGLVGEAAADGSYTAYGLFGIGATSSAFDGSGVCGVGVVTTLSDASNAIGVRGVSIDNHNIGDNIGVYGSAVNLGSGNAYSFYGAAGSLYNIGRILGYKGIDVASGTDITLGNGNYFDITGTTTIERMKGTGWTAGSIVTLQFDGSVTITRDVAAGSGFYGFKLAGASDFAATADDTLTVRFDGAWWREIARCAI